MGECQHENKDWFPVAYKESEKMELFCLDCDENLGEGDED